MHILHCVGLQIYVKFWRASLKLFAEFGTHTPHNMHFTDFIFVCDLRYLWIVSSLSFGETAFPESFEGEIKRSRATNIPRN